jgi:hypothetical protein
MELKSAVGTLLVVVIDVLLEHPLGMAPTTNDIDKHDAPTTGYGAPKMRQNDRLGSPRGGSFRTR